MKRLIFSCFFLMAGLLAAAQQLTIEQCYELAKQNYPLIKQRALIKQSSAYTMENIATGNLPQFIISGQATYQSDVTKIPIKLPNVEIPELTKDQYKLYGEINQPLTDLITVKQQKELQSVAGQIDEQNLEVELYKLHDRINQLFFGILLVDEQLKQNALTAQNIQTGINAVTARIANGTDYRSSEDKLKAEMLQTKQKAIELLSSRLAYTDMLGYFINQRLDESTILEKPAEIINAGEINRPELAVYDLQKNTFALKSKLLNTKALPKFSVFLQGGLGQPSPVNFLSNKLSGYYLGGLRLNWSLTNYYTIKKEKKINDINKDQLEVQKQTFLFNTNSTLKQQNAEVLKLQQLIKTDNEIVALRVSIKNTSNAQLSNGVITANDFLREINAEDQARQAASLHNIQLLMAQYTYKTISGNQP